MKTNDLSNIQIITVLAVIFLLMFIIYKTVTINQKRKIIPFQKNRKILSICSKLIHFLDK